MPDIQTKIEPKIAFLDSNCYESGAKKRLLVKVYRCDIEATEEITRFPLHSMEIFSKIGIININKTLGTLLQ